MMMEQRCHVGRGADVEVTNGESMRSQQDPAAGVDRGELGR